MIVAYISGHGYGHVTRSAELLRAVRERRPDLPLTIVCSAPPRLFEAAIPGRIEIRREECDVGLVQRGALAIDEQQSLLRWCEFRAAWDGRVAREAEWLRRVGARLVLGDIPPLAFVAAARAGVARLGLANFSWDWIYAHLSAREPGFSEAVEWARRAYHDAQLLLRLPFAGDLSAFRKIEDIPLIARRSRLTRAETRAKLDLDDRPLVLWSFGGHGLPGFKPAVLGPLTEFCFLLTEPVASPPANVRSLDEPQLRRQGLGYEDLVAASDVIVTKPGYGIVTDAIAGRTRLVYTDRGDFPEYPILVAGMAEFLPAVHVTNEALLAGALTAALRQVSERDFPPPPRLDGADVAAERLLGLLP
jgi:hypothetical protein